jgi:putative ABC transport system permease protein
METENTPDRKMPPAWARRLLQKWCPNSLLEEVDGDLLEEFHHQVRLAGLKKARRDYVIDVVLFILFSRRKLGQRSPLMIMWRNYILTAFRNISRNAVYSVINLAGLTVGLVCSMLIFQYVIFEHSADTFHENFDNLHRVAVRASTAGDTPETISQLPYEAGDAFKDEVPAIENFSRIRADFFQECPTISTETSLGGKVVYKDLRSIIVDTTFLDLFTFPLIKGDRKTALNLTNSVLVTESTAAKLFGTADPIGKMIDYRMNQGVIKMMITGVLRDAPANSYIQFDVVYPIEGFKANDRQRRFERRWNFNEFTTYVALSPGSDLSKTEDLMTDVMNRNLADFLAESKTTVAVELQPMSSLYFDRGTDVGMVGFGSVIVSTRTGNERMVYFISIIGAIILIIALMSYVNLSTVRSLDRAKEVGVRKVIGAHRSNLQMQFFLESALMNVTALLLAMGIVILVMPYFNRFVQTSFTIASWFNPTFILVMGAIFVGGVLLSGLYPAFVLSSFVPIAALKSNTGGFSSRARLRKFLVVLQYAPAIALVVCTIVVYTQLDFMRNMDVGLEMNKLITVRSPMMLPDSIPTSVAEASFKKELSRIKSIEAASYAGNQAGRGLNFLIQFQVDSTGSPAPQFLKGTGVDHDFLDVFKIQLLAGEPFTEGMVARYGNTDEFIRKVMINETAARTLGFPTNESAVGRLIASTNAGRYYVQAVINDFNWSSAHKAIDPVMVWYGPNNRFLTIRLAEGADFNQSIAEIRSIYDRLFPMDLFHYEFAKDVYNRQYGEDDKFSKLFTVFSGLAALIATLGLFGLSSFSAERRSREMVIRKVMGASVGQIVRLLGKEFVLLVAIALFIASPIAWLVMTVWLRSFAFHINLTALPFVITGVAAVLIAGVTVSLRSLKVAKVNPVEVLRAE